MARIEPEYASAVQFNLIGDPETKEALEDLISCLSGAETLANENAAWTFFNDRIQFLVSRAYQNAIGSRKAPEDEI